ncbi:hypothetical protein K439DRAFT_1625963 [Ramaria rubella]|nr:hypothetical protein K439DRAFT_1625963 [Ramaria rubella]
MDLSFLQDPIFRPLSYSFVCRRRTCNQARKRRFGLTKLNPVHYHYSEFTYIHSMQSYHSHWNSQPDALATYRFEMTTLQ